jgi:ArsR family transcriptional regulator
MNTRSHEIRTSESGADAGHAGGSCDAFVVDREAVERTLAALPDERTTRALAAIFGALSDPTRLRILQALLEAGRLCVCDLAEVTSASPSAVSHQLRVLRDRNLVTFSRDGKRAIYRLADDHVASLLAQGLDHAHETLTGPTGR